MLLVLVVVVVFCVVFAVVVDIDANVVDVSAMLLTIVYLCVFPFIFESFLTLKTMEPERRVRQGTSDDHDVTMRLYKAND